MRVGILSMQRIKNYGSFLQAYGLKSILESLGADVQFVDYHPGKTLIPADGGTGLKRKVTKALEAFQGSAPLSEKLRFINYKKNYAANYYPYLGITEKLNYSPEVDLLVIGSDEVFNCVQNNTNVGFSSELFGQNSNAKKIISYAASFGNTNYQKLEQYDVAGQVADWLRDFDAISVRDNNSKQTVEKLTGKAPQINLDPVLMYDFVGSNKIPTDINEKHKYMMLYGYSGRFTPKECKKIRAYANSKGLKIYCIGGVQDCCDKYIDCDPFKVIAYFQHAECVITDTFHGTIMSIITHRQFVSVVRQVGYGNSEKLVDLLNRLQLESRQLSSLNVLDAKLAESIDYTNTDDIIKHERIKTREYLKGWLTE
ncbi:polysaccharide pyruvyl transferase family protein [Lactobacillus delbrueckii]|uniref:polysaccharide pyruvyl transferase family protein n=1 Tax=Lactobacillus delbrueckii TaxID=1584 RepID=UPI0007432C55|nr:polysaccharide pyruvyl transferase family protein [Lactobacillus delbrueckii]